ncbi:MAG: UvrD-helicase domain-containing protein [Rikenellaceae bacterium]
MGQISVIKASAGSGKTYRLVYEYIRTILDNPTSYKNILAVTFTNKATSEMKSRIIEQLYQLSLGSGDYISTFTADGSKTKEFVKNRASLALNYILQDYSHFAVMTIDRFFQRIIRAFIHELGVDAGFTLELQTDGILTQATDSLIESIGDDKQLRNWITQYVEERISENKHWDIRSDIKTLGRELFNDSRSNLQYNKMSNEDLLNFVSRASQITNLIDRTMRAVATTAIGVIHNAGLSVNDFSNKASGCAGYFYKVAQNGVEPFGARVIKAIEDNEGWYTKKSESKDRIMDIVPTLRSMLESLTVLYTNNIKYINSVSQLKAKFRTYALLNDLSDKVDAFCKEQSIVPISDTNSIINGLIAGNDTPFIFEKTGNRFTDYMIDEFQDTSLTQWNNFRPLIENAMAQSEGTPVLLVGDIKQSIYRWRGGDWRILGEKINELYGSSLTQDNLDTNRRSFGNIVQFNNCLMSNCVNQDNSLLNNKLKDVLGQGFISQSTFDELTSMLSNAYEQSQQKKFKEPDKGYITITRENEKNEGDYIIEKIIELQDRGYAARDITILVRNNGTGIEIANTILNYKTSNPDDNHNFNVITGEALLLKNAAVTCFVIAVLQLSCGSDSIQAGVYNKFLGNNVSDKISESDKEFISTLRLVSLDEAFENIVMRYKLNQNEDNISYLQAIHELIISLSTNKIYDIPTFLNWWNDNKFRRSLQLPENNDAINIVSIHKSKGLQYKVVIIPECRWELDFSSNKLPLIWSNGTEQFESLPKIPMVCKKELAASHYANDFYRELVLYHVDNINLLYVALTRAIAELHICLPYISKKERKIDAIIEEAINKTEADQIEIIDTLANTEKICGKVETSDRYTIYSFGEKITAQAVISTPNPTLPFPVNRPENKLKFKVHSTIDMQGHGATKTSPREYGILMHKIFENITSKDQILPALEQMKITGEISNDDQIALSNKLETLLSNPVTELWFDGNWSELMVERSILTSNGATYRPDRVLIKGDQVIVIDYKFGLLSPKSHEKSLRNYMLLIKQMGYNSVTGYLWYIEQNRIDTHNLN